MNYPQISKETFGHLYNSYKTLSDSPLDHALRALVEVRVSQINGCAYCVGTHVKEAREAGVTQEKLDVVAAWQDAHQFSDAECAALEWAEKLTVMNKSQPKPIDALKAHFSEREIVDLTFAISLMNAFNRIAISLRDA